METIRAKSSRLTGYLESQLQSLPNKPFQIITPTDREQRGAQLSVLLEPGLLEPLLRHLQKHHIIVDERKPDVIRVAPAPVYNTFEDVWSFVEIFGKGINEIRPS